MWSYMQNFFLEMRIDNSLRAKKENLNTRLSVKITDVRLS